MGYGIWAFSASSLEPPPSMAEAPERLSDDGLWVWFYAHIMADFSHQICCEISYTSLCHMVEKLPFRHERACSTDREVSATCTCGIREQWHLWMYLYGRGQILPVVERWVCVLKALFSCAKSFACWNKLDSLAFSIVADVFALSLSCSWPPSGS